MTTAADSAIAANTRIPTVMRASTLKTPGAAMLSSQTYLSVDPALSRMRPVHAKGEMRQHRKLSLRGHHRIGIKLR